MSSLIARPEGKLFAQLVKRMCFYSDFEIDEHTGAALTEADVASRHGQTLSNLQKVAFKSFPSLKDLALSNHGTIESRDALKAALHPLPSSELRKLCTYLAVMPSVGGDDESDDVLREALIQRHETRPSNLSALAEMPLYPTEDVMWDTNVVPADTFGSKSDSCLALPKINLQFLTFSDYLLRNYNLYRLEACYEIRSSLEEVMKHVKPRRRRATYESASQRTLFTGWARMSLPVGNFQVTKVTKPNVGENHPARVVAELEYSLRDLRGDVREEWDRVRKHEVLYLLTVRATVEEGSKFVFDPKKSFCEQFGLIYARGAEVDERYDENGKEIPEWDQKTQVKGDDRKVRLLLDPQQYQLDTARMVREGAEDVYETFNLIVRRKPKENNFKSVLECMRDLMSTKVSLPTWMEEAFLGYGDPDAAHWRNIEERVDELDFKDTFLNWDHLKASFPDSKVTLAKGIKDKSPSPPFKLAFADDDAVTVTPYTLPNMGPYPRNVPKKNPIPFTPVQVDAIRSGLNHGLTMVVGPPGTGKTDVAVQMVSNLYHSFPGQRTLIITHANQALNDIFEKIMVRDVDERYLLRLGHGAKDLDTESEFTIRGRVDYMLQRRLDRLQETAKLAKALDLPDAEYTCETAAHFNLFHVQSRWNHYAAFIRNPKEAEDKDATVESMFPFTRFFEDAPQPLFKGDHDTDAEIGRGCYRYIEEMFTELLECRPFELLKTARDRGLYLLAKQAKVIAMTCTHASLKRHEFMKYGLKYDNLVMEEAAQGATPTYLQPAALRGSTALAALPAPLRCLTSALRCFQFWRSRPSSQCSSRSFKTGAAG